MTLSTQDEGAPGLSHLETGDGRLGQYRLFNDFGGSGGGGDEIGITPDPCGNSGAALAVLNWVATGQPSQYNGVSGISPSKETYWVAEGRAGIMAQLGFATINYQQTLAPNRTGEFQEGDPAGLTQGGCMKKKIRNLTGSLLVAATVLGTAQQQSATPEVRLSDLRAQQPQETIFASAPCQRATEGPRHLIGRHYTVDPRTLVPDLGTLTENSDEVILAGELDRDVFLSPSGESATTYYEVRVIRSWKGSHHPGDVLTFGVPEGLLNCKPLGPDDYSWFWPLPAGGWGFPDHGGPWLYILFLRQSRDNETKSVQGLRLAAGEGVQGMFLIPVPAPLPSDAERYCADVLKGRVEHCDSYVETSSGPVNDPYIRDPLAKKYVGMPTSDFLREVRSAAAAQGSAEKSSLK